jgi:hypothetical protein
MNVHPLFFLVIFNVWCVGAHGLKIGLGTHKVMTFLCQLWFRTNTPYSTASPLIAVPHLSNNYMYLECG